MEEVKIEPDISEQQHSRQIVMRQSTPITINSSDMSVQCAAPPSSRTLANSPTTDGDTIMTDEDPLATFGRKGRALIQSIHNLQSLGVDTTLPSLPKVVVVGDQSAGKSSIIEAISDITLPRSEGTCTRCPFNITTHAAQEGDLPWSCKVTLQSKYDYQPDRTGNSNFNGWSKHGTTEVGQFATITDKAELELTLRRAQVVVLNPHDNWQQCIKLSAAEVDSATFQVDFSPNLICLEITAPNLLELSFYDLPGAINVMTDESQDYLSDFVEKLLKSYLNDDQALVVIACPANQDVETGTAMEYLRKCKASSRATGVLTKPDLVDLTTPRLASFEGMFCGKSFWLAGGWFMTRQLSQSQLNQANRPSYEEARAQEAQFFSQSPWSTTLSEFTHRFGISSRQDAISKKHIQHILASLPGIVGRVEDRLLKVQQELKAYPKKATNPGLEVIHDIDSVVKAAVVQCSVDARKSEFRSSQKDNMKQLAKQLSIAAPKVELSTPGYMKPALLIDDSDEMDETPSKRAKVTRDGRAVNVTPRRATPHHNPNARTPMLSGSKRKAPQVEDQVSSSVGITFHLNDVKRRYDLAPSAGLPDDADPWITHDLAKEAVGAFSSITNKSLDKFRALVMSMLENSLAESLHSRQGTLLFHETATIMHNFFSELFDKEVDMICHLIGCLVHRPMTYNSEWWKTNRDRQHQQLRQGRDEARVLEYFEGLESRHFKVPSTLEEHKKKTPDPVWMANNIHSAAYAREIKELAMPLTFYELASGQLVDTVARNLDYLVYQLETRLKPQLVEGLRPHDFERSASLLAEDPKREEMRDALEQERSKLQQALEELSVARFSDSAESSNAHAPPAAVAVAL